MDDDFERETSFGSPGGTKGNKVEGSDVATAEAVEVGGHDDSCEGDSESPRERRKRKKGWEMW